MSRSYLRSGEEGASIEGGTEVPSNERTRAFLYGKDLVNNVIGVIFVVAGTCDRNRAQFFEI